MSSPDFAPFTLWCSKGSTIGENGEKRHLTEGREIDSVEALLSATARNHSVFSFKGGRKAEHWSYADVLFFDVDNDHGGPLVTPETIKQDFPGVAFCYVYSRNNGKPKEGKPATVRFHVYFPVSPSTNAEATKALLEKVWATHSPLLIRSSCTLIFCQALAVLTVAHGHA